MVFIGRYQCASDYKSTCDSVPKHQITRQTARTNIHNLGENIWQFDFCMLFTIWLLYLVEFADWDSQRKIGMGCGSSGWQLSGETNNMPYHTGTMQSNKLSRANGIQYRNIEDLWANLSPWVDGIVYGTYTSHMKVVADTPTMYIKVNPNEYTDNIGGKSTYAPSSGYPIKLSVIDNFGFPMFYPTESNSDYVSNPPSDRSYTTDKWNYFITASCIFQGGNYIYTGTEYGLFSINSNSAEYSSKSITCRLQELP